MKQSLNVWNAVWACHWLQAVDYVRLHFWEQEPAMAMACPQLRSHPSRCPQRRVADRRTPYSPYSQYPQWMVGRGVGG